MAETGKRLLLTAEATYRLQDGFIPPVSVVVNEVTPNSVRFVTTQVLPEGTPLAMTIVLSPQSDALNVTGHVIKQEHISSKFVIDTTLEFSEISPRDKSRLDSFLMHESDNIKMGRAHVRCSVTAQVSFCYDEFPDATYTCFSGDISVEGMKLFVRHPVGGGKAIKLSFELPGRMTNVDVSGTVVWERETFNNVWAVGVRFQELSDEIRDQLVKFISRHVSVKPQGS